MDENILQEISKKLSILISLQLRNDGNEAVKEHVGTLSKFGLSNVEIANILNTTAGTVSVAKARLKKR